MPILGIYKFPYGHIGWWPHFLGSDPSYDIITHLCERYVMEVGYLSWTVNFTGTVNVTGNLIMISDPVHPFIHHNLSIYKKVRSSHICIYLWLVSFASDNISHLTCPLWFIKEALIVKIFDSWLDNKSLSVAVLVEGKGMNTEIRESTRSKCKTSNNAWIKVDMELNIFNL